MEQYKRTYNTEWDFNNVNTKEYTHCYHKYPAMMIPQVARKLIEEYRPDGQIKTILDPYMGSGTTLVESLLANINAIGTDINPLARFISEIKTTTYDINAIINDYKLIDKEILSYDINKVVKQDYSRLINYLYWYKEDVLLKLSYIEQTIKVCASRPKFFLLILAELVREVSYTRKSEFKRYKITDKQIANFNPDVFGLFYKIVARNIKGLKEFNGKISHDRCMSSAQICNFNSVYEIPNDIIEDETIDMVVTSPPYGDSKTTVAYGQFSSWANQWFNFNDTKNIDRLLMGGVKQTEETFTTTSIREELDQIKNIDYNRYKDVIAFLNDYSNSIRNVAKKVRTKGKICYVVGCRTVKGIQIPLDYFTAEMFEQNNCKHIETIVRNIPSKRMPSKNSPTNKVGETVTTMNHEYIVIMEKM